ncbi:MAG TPA: WecB/TagA/CpsF family glycosyltransferase [Caulobacter sp.]|nr:WecB/TagA/CpsF family glycosyltransferase [Caulobacter sp.]
MFASLGRLGGDSAAPQRYPFRLKRRPEERVTLLGQAMDLVKAEEVLFFVANHVAQKKRAIVANHNAHSLYLLRDDAELRAFYGRADLVEVDSRPLLMWARLTGRSSRAFHRCTYLDWRDEFWALAAARGWRVYYLGAAPGVAEKAAELLRLGRPGVRIGVHDGYFDMSPGSPEAGAVLDDIRAFSPDVLMVGMGMPRQEVWIHRNYDSLPPCVVLPVGAAFDYEAGVQRAAPRWLGQIGLEWLFRLVVDPRRLFRRYCVEPWRLVGLLVDDAVNSARQRRATALRERRRAIAPPQDAPRRRASDQRGRVNLDPSIGGVPELQTGAGARRPAADRRVATLSSEG